MRTIISELPRYHKYMHGKHSIEIGYPWLTYGAIIELERILQPTFSVLELGCGGSTVFFSRRCERVDSLETDPIWAEKLPPMKNVVLICKPAEWLLEFIAGYQNEAFDLILVDSHEQQTNRLTMAEAVRSKVKRGGYFVVDNYTSRHIRNFDYKGFDVFNFDGLQHPGRGTRICIKL